VLESLTTVGYKNLEFSCRPQNMIAQSQSGTGKTAAFVLAMLSRVDPKKEYPQVSFHDQNMLN
jgi:superfamily II DNA/RNA helicase